MTGVRGKGTVAGAQRAALARVLYPRALRPFLLSHTRPPLHPILPSLPCWLAPTTLLKHQICDCESHCRGKWSGGLWSSEEVCQACSSAQTGCAVTRGLGLPAPWFWSLLG